MSITTLTVDDIGWFNIVYLPRPDLEQIHYLIESSLRGAQLPVLSGTKESNLAFLHAPRSASSFVSGGLDNK